MRSLLLLPLLLAGASAGVSADTQDRAAADQAKLAKELGGLTVKGTTDCLSNIGAQRQTIGVGPVILYKVNRNLVYRNDTSGGCEGIAHGDILVTRSYTGRLCRGDLARTISPAGRFPTGSCSLGAFTTYSAK